MTTNDKWTVTGLAVFVLLSLASAPLQGDAAQFALGAITLVTAAIIVPELRRALRGLVTGKRDDQR